MRPTIALVGTPAVFWSRAFELSGGLPDNHGFSVAVTRRLARGRIDRLLAPRSSSIHPGYADPCLQRTGGSGCPSQ